MVLVDLEASSCRVQELLIQGVDLRHVQVAVASPTLDPPLDRRQVQLVQRLL